MPTEITVKFKGRTIPKGDAGGAKAASAALSRAAHSQRPPADQGSPRALVAPHSSSFSALAKQGGDGGSAHLGFCFVVQAEHARCSSVCGLSATRVLCEDAVCGQRVRHRKAFLE